MPQKDVPTAGDTPRIDTNGGVSEAESLASLKKLLFAQEQAELSALRQQLEASGLSADELSELLPKAIWTASSRDEQLSEAMGPLLGTAIKSAIKNDADSIAEAISPIMGPAIRATIQQAIRGMVQSLNKTLEYSVSTKGLKWRWEAFTTGKSFAEVVMLHTLRYRVEQAVLIDRETGLLIKHAALLDETADNADLTSAMLTALQDFGRDSLGAAENESLNNFTIGDKTVWAETGPHAFLALVIEGEAPASLRTTMQESLEQIHMRFSQELESYSGDSTPFAAVDPILDGCLLSAYEEDDQAEAPEPVEKPAPKQPLPLWKKALIGIAIAGLLFGILRWKQGMNYRSKLTNVRRQLAAPDSVDIEIKDGELIATGEARDRWIQETTTQATRLADVRSVRLEDVQNLDTAWRNYLAAIEATPGLVVTRTAANDGQYELSGLRDPLAADPHGMLKNFELTPECVAATWRPFQSLENDLVAKRIRAAVPPNDSVRIELRDQTLRFSGTALPGWKVRAEDIASRLANDTLKLDFSGLDEPRKHDANPAPPPLPEGPTLGELRTRLSRRYILFDGQTGKLSAYQKSLLPGIADDLKRIIQTAEDQQQEVQITLVATAKGSDQQAAIALSKQRAKAVWKALQPFDLPAGHVLIKGVGTGRLASTPPGFTGEMSQHCCLFRITLTPNP